MGFYISLGFILLLLFFFSGVFSASESVLSSFSKAKIESSTLSKRVKKTIFKFYDKYEHTLTVILVANNIINILISVIISTLFAGLALNESLQIIVSLAATTPPIIIFGEIYPKIFGRKNPILFLKLFWFLIAGAYYLFYPMAAFITHFIKKNHITNTENELKKIISQGEREGVLEKDESDLAIRALEFDSMRTDKYYTKIKDVVYVDYEDSFDHIVDVFIKNMFSRIPVWQKDQFVGILLAKDILHLSEFQIEDHIIKVPFLSANGLIKQNYDILKKEKTHMGFVTADEKSNKVIGILTFEDILESIFGPIYDEHDYRDNLEIYEISENEIIAFGTTSILTINKSLNINLPTNSKDLQEFLITKAGNKKIVKGRKIIIKQDKYQLGFDILSKDSNVIEVKISKYVDQ